MTNTTDQRLREIQERVEKARASGATRGSRLLREDVPWLLEQIAALTREKAESVVTEALVPTNQALISAADERWQPLLDAQWAVHDDPADMTNAELACALACRLGYLEAALSAGQAESDTKP